MRSFLFFLGELSMCFTFLSLIAALVIRFKRRLPDFVIPVFVFSILESLAEILGLVMHHYKYNNQNVYHVFTVFEFLLFLLFYIQYFKYLKHIKWSYLFIPAFLVVVYIDYTLNGLKSMDALSITVESAFYIVVSLLSFGYILKQMSEEPILNQSFFWINAGVLIYFSGNILLFLMESYLTKHNLLFNYYSLIHSPLNMMFNTALCIGFYKSK